MAKKKKTKTIFDMIAVVHWDDAASHDLSWIDTESGLGDQGLIRIISTGFLLEETEKVVKLMRSSHADGETIEGVFAIPRQWVERIDYIPYNVTPKKVRKKKESSDADTPLQ